MPQGNGYTETLGANGSTTEKLFIGPIYIQITGTFGAGTAQLQARDPSGNLVDLDAATGLTADGSYFLNLPVGALNYLSVALTGATSPSVIVWIQGKRLGLN